MAEIEKKRVIDLLNRILESELAGVIRYTHYSLLVFGYTRIPIVSWLRERFIANWPRISALYDERFCRMWEFYLVLCEIGFRFRSMMVFQMQLAKCPSANMLILWSRL